LSSETFVEGYYSPIFTDVFASLVIAHFLIPVSRRTPIVYTTLFILGIISTLYYLQGNKPIYMSLTIDIVRKQCGYQVLFDRPRDVRSPDDPIPLDPCLHCEAVADAWWSNVIVT
jgi:hypothetical protein